MHRAGLLFLMLGSLAGCSCVDPGPRGELSLTADRAPRGQVLVVMSAADRIELANGDAHPTGYFLGELMHPVEAILAAGYEVTFATPGGAAPTLDEDSLHTIYWVGAGAVRARQHARVKGSAKVARPLKLEALDGRALARFDGLFLPGGHAPMVDLAQSPAMGRVFRHFHRERKPTGVLCHAPAALLAALPERDGSSEPWPYAGYEMALFTRFEESFSETFFLGGDVPYYIDEELEKAGAETSSCLNPFSPSSAIRDRELITGQNPFSAEEFAELFVVALNEVCVPVTRGLAR